MRTVLVLAVASLCACGGSKHDTKAETTPRPLKKSGGPPDVAVATAPQTQPNDLPRTGIVECDDLYATYLTCMKTQLPADSYKSVEEAIRQALLSMQGMTDPNSIAAMRQACQSSRAQFAQQMSQFNCGF